MVLDIAKPHRPLRSSNATATVSLLCLPSEIRHMVYDGMICSYIIDFDIATQPGAAYPRLLDKTSKGLSSLLQLSLASKSLRLEVHKYITDKARLHCASTDTFLQLPKSIGIINVAQITTFQLKLDPAWLIDHEILWPRLIELIVKAMPQLCHLTLYSWCPDYKSDWRNQRHDHLRKTNWKYRMTYCVTCRDMGKRALLRLGAFVELRHPNLRLLVHPAHSYASYGEDAMVQWIPYAAIGEKPNNKQMCVVELFQDGSLFQKWQRLKFDEHSVEHTGKHTVLNATAIRRETWAELLGATISRFALPPHAEVSDVHETHSEFTNVDEFAYIAESETASGKVTVDKLIEQAREKIVVSS